MNVIYPMHLWYLPKANANAIQVRHLDLESEYAKHPMLPPFPSSQKRRQYYYDY